MESQLAAVHFSKNRRGIENDSNRVAKAVSMMPVMGTRKTPAIVVSLLLVMGAAAAFAFVPREDQAVRTDLISQKQTKGTKEGDELSLFSSLPSVEK